MRMRIRSCVRQAVEVTAFGVAVAALAPSQSQAKEDLEFVQEHLPEVAMDNRYATLPLWSGARAQDNPFALYVQGAFSSTSAGNLKIDGPLLSIGGRWQLSDRWGVGGFGFYDPLRLQGSREYRDLETLFAPTTPIERPVAAEFAGLNGTATDIGLGAYVSLDHEAGFLGAHRWIGGVLWQRLTLTDYRFDYRLLVGPQTGLTGKIDFDARYEHVVPFAGLELLRNYGTWATSAHALIALPLPRRGIVGHIEGPGFDVRGDTDSAGNGKHFGDPSLTLGYTITYVPAHLSFDLGTFATQALLESRIHRGIERNVVLSFSVAW
jgi:hypothetical protein